MGKRLTMMRRDTVVLRLAAMVLLTVLVLALHGCNGGGGGSSSNGTLQVGLTDRKTTAFQQVVVSIREVRVVPAGLENADDNDPRLPVVATFNPSHVVDILTLHLQQELLGTVVIPAGSYTQLRLVLDPNPSGQAQPVNYVTLPSNQSVRIPLDTPSGQQSGLKVLGQFQVQAGVINAIMIDFDPTTAIVARGNGGFNLKPTGIRLIQPTSPLTTFGSFAGRVVALTNFSSATVSVIPQGSATPVAAGTVFSNLSGSRWNGPFTAFAPPGVYRVHIQAPRFAHFSTPQRSIAAGSETALGDLLLQPAP